MSYEKILTRADALDIAGCAGHRLSPPPGVPSSRSGPQEARRTCSEGIVRALRPGTVSGCVGLSQCRHQREVGDGV